MVLAGGFHGMHGLGFGLGFLNLIGTILFFVFIVMAIKFFVKGRHYAHERGHWGKNAPWTKEEFWQQRREGSRPWQGGHNALDDEAMSVARERLAQGEITPEQFEIIKGGLRVDMSDSPLGRHDRAVHLARLRFAKGEITLEEFEAVKKTLLS